MGEKKPTDIEKNGFIGAVIEGSAASTVQIHGDAAKQHFVAYSGYDNEHGKVLSKGLKQVSESNVNLDYADQNIKQQAGFSAEIKSVARENAKRIIGGDSRRAVRTDDLGRVNDPLYDVVDIDVYGNVIPASGYQMKFVGSSPEDLLKKLNSSKYQKYIDADALLSVADDDYTELIGSPGRPGIIDSKIEELKEQATRAEKLGKRDVEAAKSAQIKKYQQIKNNLRKSGLTRKEAIEARLSPKLSTVKDVAQISHAAGLEQAKYGAAITGSVALIKNIVACSKKEKDIGSAALDVGKSIGIGAATSYSTAAVGSTLKGAMQNAEARYLRSLAKTNLAAGLVTTTIHIGKTMSKYISGEIDGVQCIEDLGENGLGEIGSAMFSSIGIAAVPSTAPAIASVIGGIAGATLGYAAAVAVYKELSTSLKEAKLAHEQRVAIEAECAEAIKLIEEYRSDMNRLIERYFSEHLSTINSEFRKLDQSLLEDDADGFILSNASLQRLLGKEAQFTSQEEFDMCMESDHAIRL